MPKFKSKQIFIASCFLVLFNLSISFLIQKFGIWHINNYNQELFKYGWLSFLTTILIGIIIIFKLKLHLKHPFVLTTIIAGVVSNAVERIYQGYVSDYINLAIAVANFADLLIYICSVILIYKEISTDNKIKSLV